MNGVAAAQRHFSAELKTDLKESTVRTWKMKYLKELSQRRRAGTVDMEVTSLPSKRRGRPLMLGEKLDMKVKSYFQAVRERGGVLTTAITMASATAIVRREDRNLLLKNGGSVDITAN